MGPGATVAGAVAGATVVAWATAVLDVAAAAGATAAWAGGRVALRPVPRSAPYWRPLTTTIRSRLIRPITITLIRRLPITTMAWVPAAAATEPVLASTGIESLVVSGSVGRAVPRSTAARRMPSHYLALTQSRCRRRRNRHRRRQSRRRHPNLVADRRRRRPRSADPIRRRGRCR
jgi:hypothetical protein